MMKHLLTILAIGILAAASGCHAIDFYTPSLQKPLAPELEPPRELEMVSLPPYRIEPPDVIRIEVVKLVPRQPYRVGQSDALSIKVLGTLKGQPIQGMYSVNDDGMVNLGGAYGMVRVEGFTIDEVEKAITLTLRTILNAPEVSVQLARSAVVEQFNGPYQVGMDGVINLRRCGMVNVAGKTIAEVREAMQARLAQYFDSPKVSVEIVQYNSDRYYVIVATARNGEVMLKFPITGNETVLDAVGRIPNLSNISTKTMWLARPAPESLAATRFCRSIGTTLPAAA